MEQLEQFLNTLSGIIWGPFMLMLLVGVGIYLTIGLRAIPWRKLGYSFQLLWRGRVPEKGAAGEIPPFHAFMTALSATVGSGNVAGVATAIYLGGSVRANRSLTSFNARSWLKGRQEKMSMLI